MNDASRVEWHTRNDVIYVRPKKGLQNYTFK